MTMQFLAKIKKTVLFPETIVSAEPPLCPSCPPCY